MRMTRRTALATLGAGAGLAIESSAIPRGNVPADIVRRHDAAVRHYLEIQVTEPTSRGYGNIPTLTPDGKNLGVYAPTAASGLIATFMAAYLYPESQFHRNALLVERMKLAVSFLRKAQHDDGLIDYVNTNFDSPPDTAFTCLGVATAACLANRARERELVAVTEPFLRKAARGMATGGVHTPNHRWVVSSALAQINEVFPDPALVRRIDQWLAEGIDIDADGQYTERSTTVYNPICDRAFTVMAAKLNRPALLEPVRKNLESMLYLLHADYGVVTEISRRQDRNTEGDMSRYWFPLRYLAVKDQNGQFAALAGYYDEISASLPELMEYPEILGPAPAPVAPPHDYARVFKELGIVRFRRGAVSSTLLSGDAGFFASRANGVVIQAIRFAGAFFGKGQFEGAAIKRAGDHYILSQHLEAGYYQPLEPPRRVAAGEWSRTRPERRETQRCSLDQRVALRETPRGFQIRIQSSGTKQVPIAVEVSLRQGGRLEGCETTAPGVALLAAGRAKYTGTNGSVRFGPGICEHRWTEIRGALPKLPGTSVYLTGFTPFDHTLEIEWA
jgi:hypothetical protein